MCIIDQQRNKTSTKYSKSHTTSRDVIARLRNNVGLFASGFYAKIR